MEGYFRWAAYAVERNGVDGFLLENITYHRCTDEDWKDKLHPVAEGGSPIIEFMKPYLMCIDDISLLRMRGNQYTTNLNGVGISLLKCVGDPKCKSSEEIDQYIDSMSLNLVYYSNTVSYRQDKYGE